MTGGPGAPPTPETGKLQRQILKLTRIGDGYQAQLRTLNEHLAETNQRLSQALAEVRTLRGFLPICARCKKIRTDSGFWEQIEAYVGRHSEAVFSHGVCPDCLPLLFPRQHLAKAPPAQAAEGASLEARALEERLEELRQDPSRRDHPLVAEFQELARTHLALIRRSDKVARISDAYQSQMKAMAETLKTCARVDSLTGLLNRRAMVQGIRSEISRSVRERSPLSVVMLDIDRFKSINDTWGHSTGDEVLQTVAKAVASSLRAYDQCSRWGGEEFLVLLPATDLMGAKEVAEKLRLQIAGRSTPVGGSAVQVTVSLGVACLLEGEGIDAVLHRADLAMYEAKRQGGNETLSSPGRAAGK